MKYAEFAKLQWPARSECHECRELSMPPRAGVRQELRWRHDTVHRLLLETYCLEPRFECWEQLQRLVGGKHHAPAAELSGYYGTLIMLAGVAALLVLTCCGCTSRSKCDSDAPAKPGKKKSDHVV